MAKRGKINKSEWADYDHHFWELCIQKGWKAEIDDDDLPILRPARAKDCYKVFTHSSGRYGCCILATHGTTKKAIIDKMIKAKLPRLDQDGRIVHEDLVECDTEAIVYFSEDRLARAVKTLNLKRKKKRKAPTKQQIEKALAGVKRYHERRKNAAKSAGQSK
jgi:hypothetical protein